MNGTQRFSGNPDWGIPFPRPVATGAGLELTEAPVPDQLTVPLNQHVGTAAEPLVRVGATVDKGQPIGATAPQHLGGRIHAPSSGRVIGLTELQLPGRGTTLAVEIAVDGEDRRWAGYEPQPRPLQLTPKAIREAIIEAGIVGLGGAMFPAGVKLNPGSGITTLILNGAECEPQINCDDALMRHQPTEILLGAQIMLRVLEADECLIAIKESTGPARDALAIALTELDDDRIRIATVPAIYPVGGEAQLIQLLTGREIPSGGLPWDTGVACQNVGTAAAITRFFSHGEPLLSRIVTVTGHGVRNPLNIIARFGTPIATLVACAGGYQETASRLILGGPMMGIAAPTDAIPVTKATNCVYVAATTELAVIGPEMPCIRCSDCAVACPVELSPQLLLEARRANDFEKLEQLGLMDCIECGCCDFVCPSQIPLTRSFHASKREVWGHRITQRAARQAEQRFEARSIRLANQAEQQASALAEQLSVFKDAAGEQPLAELKRRLDSKSSRPPPADAD